MTLPSIELLALSYILCHTFSIRPVYKSSCHTINITHGYDWPRLHTNRILARCNTPSRSMQQRHVRHSFSNIARPLAGGMPALALSCGTSVLSGTSHGPRLPTLLSLGQVFPCNASSHFFFGDGLGSVRPTAPNLLHVVSQCFLQSLAPTSSPSTASLVHTHTHTLTHPSLVTTTSIEL